MGLTITEQETSQQTLETGVRGLRFTSEFVLIPCEQGVIVDGGGKPEMLTGALATTLLPLLLNRINGQCTAADLVTLAPQGQQKQAMAMLELLVNMGVVTSESAPEHLHANTHSTLSYLRRIDPSTDTAAAAAILEQCRILIVGDLLTTSFSVQLTEALVANGFQHVDAVSLKEAQHETRKDKALIIVPAHVDTGAHRNYEQFGEQVSNLGLRWMRTTLDAFTAEVEIGPIFEQGAKLCLYCLAKRNLAAASLASPFSEADQSQWIALIASTASRHLLSGTEHQVRAVHTYNLRNLQSTLTTWPLASACSCHGRNVSEPSMAELYESAIATRHDVIPTRAGPFASCPVITPGKRALNSASVPLPEVAPVLTAPVIDLLFFKKLPPVAVDIDIVSTLLSLSAGYRSLGDTKRRWAPSGGNLGSVEIYLLVTKAMGALTPGVYFYQAENHALARLHQRGIDHLQQTRDALSIPVGDQAATLVLVGAYGRISRKYGAFAYKLSHMDGGSAANQLLLSAAALGVAVHSIAACDATGLYAALSLQPSKEILIQAFRLGAEPEQTAARRELPVLNARSDTRVAIRTNSAPGEIPDSALVDQLARSERISKSCLPLQLRQVARLRRIRLLRRASPGFHLEATFGAALNKRASVRTFSARRLSKLEIEIILGSALANTAAANSGLEIAVYLQQQPSDIAEGVYCYDAGRGELNMVREDVSRQQLGALFFQPGCEDAPMIVVFNTRLRSADHYQAQLVRAGFLGHRLWMASIGRGLGGVLIAGVRPIANDMSLPSASSTPMPLIAYLCGYEQSTCL